MTSGSTKRVNSTLAAIMTAAVEGVKEHMQEDLTPAVVILGEGDWVDVNPGYWPDPDEAAKYERLVAHMASQIFCNYGALAVPMVAVERDTPTGKTVAFHEPTPVLLTEGSYEMIWVLGFDLEDGYHVGRVLVSRNPYGAPVFGEIEVIKGETRLREGAPGFTLMQSLLESTEE